MRRPCVPRRPPARPAPRPPPRPPRSGWGGSWGISRGGASRGSRPPPGDCRDCPAGRAHPRTLPGGRGLTHGPVPRSPQTKKVRDLEKELRGLENKLSAEQERRKGLERALLPYQLNAVNTEVSGSGGRSRSNTAPAAHIGVPKVPSENALAGEDVGVLAEEIETFRSQLGKDVVNMERELAAFRVEASKTLEAMHKAQVRLAGEGAAGGGGLD